MRFEFAPKLFICFLLGFFCLEANAGFFSGCNIFGRIAKNIPPSLDTVNAAPSLSAPRTARKWAEPIRAGGEYTIDLFRNIKSHEELAANPEAFVNARRTQAGALKEAILERSVESYVGPDTTLELFLDNQKSYRGRVHNALKEDPYHVEFFDYASGKIAKIDLRQVQSAHLDNDSKLQMPKDLRNSFQKLSSAGLRFFIKLSVSSRMTLNQSLLLANMNLYAIYFWSRFFGWVIGNYEDIFWNGFSYSC